MLVKIMPEAVSNSWSLLKEVIRRNSMPLVKLDEKGLSSVFEKLLCNNMSCWYGVDGDKVHTVVLTEILSESGTETKNLIIFTVSIIDKVAPDEYVSMLETIRTYAKSHNCANVFFYSSNERITKLFENYGADTSYTLVRYQL